MHPHYLIRMFINEESAQSWLNQVYAQGYALASISRDTATASEILIVAEFRSRDRRSAFLWGQLFRRLGHGWQRG